jgi:hypothetical protein
MGGNGRVGEEFQDFGQVAKELEGVAEALLGVEEEAGAGRQGLSFPAGLYEAPRVGVDFAELPADFVIGPALEEVSGAELGEGEVVADAGMMGAFGAGGLVGGECFVDATEAQEGVATVAGGGLVAEGFGLLEGLDCVVDMGCAFGIAPVWRGWRGCQKSLGRDVGNADLYRG